jgi:hypothetical protein
VPSPALVLLAVRSPPRSAASRTVCSSWSWLRITPPVGTTRPRPGDAIPTTMPALHERTSSRPEARAASPPKHVRSLRRQRAG